jgi:hypothetical protein
VQAEVRSNNLDTADIVRDGDISTTNHGIVCGVDNPTNPFIAKPFYRLALGADWQNATGAKHGLDFHHPSATIIEQTEM